MQLVVSGIVVGSIYALSALGFVLIYKSSRVLNIAHGQIIATGQGYKSKKACLNGIESVKKNAPGADIVEADG